MMEFVQQYVGAGPEDITWWQMCIRALVVMVYAIVLLRLGARRVLGNGTVLDIVLAVIIGSSLSRALTGTADLLPTMAATAVLVVLHSLLAALAMRFGWFSRLVKGRATRVVEDGRIDWKAARRALLGEHDLREELRLRGIADASDVEAAYIERNGRFSAIRRYRPERR